MNWLSRNLARKRLGVTEPVLNALIHSGLLGQLSATGMISDLAIQRYQQFGTQWSKDEWFVPTVRMIDEQVYENLPPIEGIGPQPPATRTHMYVYPPGSTSGNPPERVEKVDSGWIAQFYLVPNYYYFPNPTELALIWPPPLMLPEPRPIPGTDLPVTLYPHPSGSLGLVVVEGLDRRPPENAIGEAHDIAMPVLDELSTRYDVPLPVAHTLVVGVPSGMLHLDFPHRPKARTIETEAEILPGCPHPELKDAYALYREAVSSNYPFHAFLTFWKVWEEAEYVRNRRGARVKRSDTKVRKEVFPDLFAFGAKPEELAVLSEDPEESPEERLRGEKFSKAKKVLNAPYRVALAHAGRVDAGKPLTGASYSEYLKVAAQVAVIRYVANVVLENVRAAFDADAEIEGAEPPEEGRRADLEETA